MYYEDAIKQYRRALKIPKRRMTNEHFEHLSIARWTCTEMLSYLKDHRDMVPLDAATEFRKKMEWGSVYSVNRFFYSTAEDTAQDIIDHIWYSR